MQNVGAARTFKAGTHGIDVGLRFGDEAVHHRGAVEKRCAVQRCHARPPAHDVRVGALGQEVRHDFVCNVFLRALLLVWMAGREAGREEDVSA